MAIRTARPADAPAIAAVHVATWRQAYRGLLPDELLRDLSVEQRRQMWERIVGAGAETVLVYDDGGQIQGFVACGACRDEDRKAAGGEIHAIYVDPGSWGRGRGAALMNEALERLHVTGFEDVSLWVLEGNQRAIRFYELAGFASDGAAKDEQIGDAKLRELRYLRAL